GLYTTAARRELVERDGRFGGEGGIRTHVPPHGDKALSRRPRYDHFGTSPYSESICRARAAARRSRKKSRRSSEASLPSTPRVTSNRWLKSAPDARSTSIRSRAPTFRSG